MDPIVLMILTIATNALVTGVLLFLFQKRIEDRYARRIFDDQLKSKIVHEKRFQTLETLYQMIAKFNRNFTNEIHQIAIYDKSSKKLSLTNTTLLKNFDGAHKELDKCRTYFNDNRIFLPTDMANEIHRILMDAAIPHTLIEVITVVEADTEHIPMAVQLINNHSGVPGLKINPLQEDDADLRRWILDLSFFTMSLTRALEALYKSSANIQ